MATTRNTKFIARLSIKEVGKETIGDKYNTEVIAIERELINITLERTGLARVVEAISKALAMTTDTIKED